MESVEQDLREFITANFLFGDVCTITNTDSFLESGMMDSTGVLELIQFLEQRFEIQIADEEMISENLDSIAKIEHFVTGKQKQTIVSYRGHPCVG